LEKLHRGAELMPLKAGQKLKTPEIFSGAHLIAKDFDGTVAQTFEKSPNGIGVNEVHELVIEDMFGLKSLERFLKKGGLQNRAPIEVVKDIAPDTDNSDLTELTDRFIEKKLSFYLGEIGSLFPDGSMWPRPTDGYLEFRAQIECARADGHLIDDLILSSGHEPFIEDTYRAWNAGKPTHIVAVETIKNLGLQLPMEKLVKPSPVLMEVAGNLWREGYGLEPSGTLAGDERNRIVYIGDDPVKDGELAKNSGVDFMLLDPTCSQEVWQAVALRLNIGQTALNGSRQHG
jgi:hypothetical protein